MDFLTTFDDVTKELKNMVQHLLKLINHMDYTI